MEYIHHYTTLQNLALILSSGKLRFTRFDLLDDKEEVSVIPEEVAFIRTWCFVSSWTDSEKESVPLWKMYSSIYDGVRISMPVDMFNKYNIPFFSKETHFGGGILNSPLTKDEIFYNGKYLVTNKFVKEKCDFYKTVECRDDVAELYKSFFKYDGKTLVASNLWDWGKYKYSHWDFLKEVRFVILTKPLPPLNHPKINNNYDNQYKYIDYAYNQPNSDRYIDVSLSKDALTNIKITMAPCISDANRILLRALVRDNGIDERCISDSEFKGKLTK